MASGSSDAATSAMASGSSDAGNVCPGPASILLLEEGYPAASRNDTTATTRSWANHTVEFTLWIADPPAVSFYTFHCIKNPKYKYLDLTSSYLELNDDQGVHAVVAGAHGRFLLIRTILTRMGTEYEYFVYKSHPDSPSLESIPPIPFDDTLKGAQFGIVPRGDDGHYLLVALRPMVKSRYHYCLYIYSSEHTAWTAKDLPNPCPELGQVLANKVFTLGDGSVLFVDLLKGMLTCDVLRRPLCAQYIPLPEPLPGNREKVEKYVMGAGIFRDLTCVDGRLMKFIDMEHREIVSEIVPEVPPEEPVNPRTKNVLYDSELIMRSKRKQVKFKPKFRRSLDGWSATLWTREIGSNCWLKGSDVDVKDILVDDFSALLSSNKSESTGSLALTFQDLNWVRPNLSMDGNDILYLRSTCTQLGVSVLAAVNLVDRTLKVEAPAVHTIGKHPPSKQILHPCALAKHLEVTPGMKVSANLIAQLRISGNEPKPNSSANRVGEPDSCESENKRPRHLAENVNHAQTEAQSTAHNVLISQAHPNQNIQNVLISQAHPNQNNMPPWLCFNRYQQPGYSGYSSCPHQNNPPPPPPPSYINNWVGPYNPVYAPSTPAPNIQSYVNYQSLPQQPLLQEQQTTPSMAFGPHMAHPIYTSTTGMEPATMGIGSSVDPYTYGAHSGSGFYHQR